MPPSQNLTNFSSHCKLYYQKSLSIDGSKASQRFVHDSASYQACEVVLEALHHQLINVHSDSKSREYEEFLSSDKVKEFSSQLKSCGLLPDKRYEVDPESTMTESHLDHQTLARYTKIRDNERRNAHKLEMEQRGHYLTKLIQSGKSISKDSPETLSIVGNKVASDAFLREVRRKVKVFCAKYKGCIGTHSFISGIKTMIEKQLYHKDSSLVLWTFNGYILSEASVQSASANITLTTYMDEAVEILYAFMFLCPNEEEDEGECFESMFSFHVHSSISNPFLRNILSDFPHGRELHARSAGTFKVLSASTDKRQNVEGNSDEYNMTLLLPWKHGFRCDIL